MLRTANPKDFKNATFDALRFFFFCLMQLDERMLLSCDVHWPCKECVIFLCTLYSVQYEHLMLTLSLSLSYVQSDGDLFFSKIE